MFIVNTNGVKYNILNGTLREPRSRGPTKEKKPEKNVLPRIPSHGDIIIQHSLVIFYVV